MGCTQVKQVETPEVTRSLEAALGKRQAEFSRLYVQVCKKLKRGTVHDLRTSSRRLIAALDLLKELEAPVKLSRIRKELKKLQDGLRDLRDLQVERKRVKREGAGNGAALGFIQQLKQAEKREKRTARAALRKFPAKRVKARIDGLLEYLNRSAELEPGFEDEIRDLATQHLRDRYRELRSAIRRVSAAKAPPALELHQVRIRFKHFRYAWELVEPYLRHDPAIEASLKEFQSLLGDIQDLHVLLGTLVSAPRPPELAPYTRTLARQQRQLIGKFRKTYPSVLSGFKGPVTQGVQVRAT